MISESARLIAVELNRYLQEVLGTSDTLVQLGNIGDLEQDTEDRLKELIIVSIVNIEEESALKNLNPIAMQNASGGRTIHDPPVYVNLYLLFSSTYNQTGDFYERALGRLSMVFEFFQSKRMFTVNNSPSNDVSQSTLIDPDDRGFLKIFMELYTLTFEQINHLWGSLGGKQVPFAMYKARLVRVTGRRTKGSGPLIEEVGREGRAIASKGVN